MRDVCVYGVYMRVYMSVCFKNCTSTKIIMALVYSVEVGKEERFPLEKIQSNLE